MLLRYIKNSAEGGGNLSLDDRIREYEIGTFTRTEEIAKMIKRTLDLSLVPNFPSNDFHEMVQAFFGPPPQGDEREQPKREDVSSTGLVE